MAFECLDVSKHFEGRNGRVEALRDITFRAEDESFVCIVGPSGCGKTTLLKIIDGLVEPSSGEVRFEANGAGSANGLRSALVFQEHGLFPWMKVVDNVAFGLEGRGLAPRERLDRARDFIDRVGLGAFAEAYPSELSGGMRQRVGIARAFLADPDILLMDEPFGALDAQTKLLLQQELLNIWSARRKLIVYVTHDIEEAVLMGDRVLVMTGRPGRIRAEISIPLERPRDLSGRGKPEVAEIKWHIWEMLREEVAQGLSAVSG